MSQNLQPGDGDGGWLVGPRADPAVRDTGSQVIDRAVAGGLPPEKG